MDSSHSSARSGSEFLLHVFDTIHNHELEREEYKHLSKTERQLTYMEQAFIVKAVSVNIGATRAHHLLTDIKGSYLLVHDNHRKCVTVAAGLLKNETTKSYIWLLKVFMKAFGKAPSIVVTDQDGAMKNAIQAEFGGFKHRLCMWHITQKLFAKICAKIYDETDFKKKLNKIVWNMYISPEEFEYKWGKLMEEFKLKNHKWLTKMFNIRSTWISAYFIDSPLCGLMRTTSRLETMEKQRHVQERMDHKIIDIVPKLKTLLKIEHHASNVYTRSLFELSPYLYEMPNKKKKKPQSVDKGNDKAEENDKVDLFFKKDGLYKVLRNVGDGSVVCSRQLFVRVGILCKHIFYVFKNANVELIQQQYILRRWTKNLILAALRNKRNRYGEKNVVVKNYANEATSIVDHCVHLLSKDEPRLGAFVEKLKSLKKEVEADCPNPPSKNKTDNLEQLVGVPKPNSCSLCGGTDHNKRTCPQWFEGQDEVVFQKEVGQEEVLVKKEVCQEEVVQEKVDLAEDEEELSKEDEGLIHE
ncbi:protein FAR1-related sequence 5 [Tanacetum coccineum]